MALILVVLERARQNQTLNSATASDKRWRLLEQAGAEELDEFDVADRRGRHAPVSDPRP